MDGEERHEARVPDEEACRNCNARVSAHRAEPWHGARAHEADRQPVLEHKRVGWPSLNITRGWR